MAGLIRSFTDLQESVERGNGPVVTLFSGGLDSTYLLHRLASAGVREIHALSVDLGDVEDNAAKVQLAAHFNAKLHLIDGKTEFTEDFVRPAILAHAVYLDTHPISSSLSRPMIARAAVSLSDSLGSDMILHTANRSQNTLRRLNGAFRDLGYTGAYGTPYDLNPVDRVEKLDVLRTAGLDLLASRELSGDSNLWCREYESGFLDDPEAHDSNRVDFQWTAPTTRAEDRIRVVVERGLPVAIDGARMALEELIEHLNVRVGAFGHGRYSGLEHLEGGQKVFEVREMPAVWLIFKTIRHLETATLPAETMRIKLMMEQIWVREALEGRWFQSLRRGAESFFETTAATVNGHVEWLISPRGAETASITASAPLYLRDREEWERTDISREKSSIVSSFASRNRLVAAAP